MKHIIAFTLALSCAPLVAAPLDKPKALCTAAIAETLKDPESIRVTSFSEWGDQRFGGATVKMFGATVNAKNSFGGYVGERPYQCLISADGTRVVDIKAF